MKMIERNIIAAGSNVNEVGLVLAKQSGVEFSGTEDEASLNGGLNRKPVTQNDDNTVNHARDNTAVVQPRFYNLIVQAGLKDIDLLEQMKDAEPGGPWDLVSRDDALLLVKRDFSKAPFRYYRWKGEDGQLLKFRYSSNNKGKLSKATNVEVSTWGDGGDKTFKTGDFNAVDDENTVMGDTEPTSIRGSDIESEDDQGGAYSGTKTAFKATAIAALNVIFPAAGAVATVNEVYKYLSAEEEGKLNEDFYLAPGEKESTELDEPYNPSANMAATFRDSSGKVWYTPMKFGAATVDIAGNEYQGDAGQLLSLDSVVAYTLVVPLDLSFREISSEPDASDATGGSGNVSAEAINARAKAAMEIHNASVKVVGNPIAESGQIISFMGIGVKNSGNWFVMESIHLVEVGKAYLTTMKVLRNGTGVTDTVGNLAKTNKPTNNQPSETTSPEEVVEVTEDKVPDNCRLLTLNETEVYQAIVQAGREAVGYYNFIRDGFELLEQEGANINEDGTINNFNIYFELQLTIAENNLYSSLRRLVPQENSENFEKLLANFETEYSKIATKLDRGIICPKDKDGKVLKPTLDNGIKAARTYLTNIITLLKSRGL